MSLSFATTAAWGLLVLASFIGWGGAIAARLFPDRPVDKGLRAAWGMAFAILCGGTAALPGFATRGLIFVWVALGVLAAIVLAWRSASRPDVRALLAHWKDRPGTALLLLLGGLSALLQYAGAICNLRFNPNDDFIAYFPFAEQILQQGTLFDPFSTRRVMSFGGHSLLHALALAGSASFRLHMLDQGMCLLVACLLVLGSRTKDRSGLPALLGFLILLTLPDIRINTYSEMSGVVAFYGLYRTLAWLEEKDSRRSSALIVALTATAICTLRSNYIAVAVPMVAMSYAHAFWKDRSRLGEALQAAGFSAAFLAPWMILSYGSSGTPLFPILKGNFNPAFPMLQSAGNWQQQFSDLIATVTQHRLVATFPLLFLSGLLMPDRSLRRPLHALLMSTAIGWVLLVHTLASDVPSFERYVYGFVVACALAVTTRITIRPDAVLARAAYAMAALGALGQLVFMSADAIRTHEDLVQKVAVLARLPIRPAATMPVAHVYRTLQSRVPPHETLLVMVDYPFLFDFRRNDIYNIDTAAAVSPPPGFPYFHGPEAIASYLAAQHIRYLAFVRPDRSFSLYRRDFWEAQQLDAEGFWHEQAPVYLDLFRNLEALATSRKRVFDDGANVLLDLNGRANSGAASPPPE